jgi:Na+/H+-translocating membrane pyrophosphatase
MAGFGFGASTIGMFARVGGGVFTKAADVGSDLVGKVEQGIPEDDPRNPAVIADNVGDNVGDVAGMGADLFESYAGACAASAHRAPHMLRHITPPLHPCRLAIIASALSLAGAVIATATLAPRFAADTVSSSTSYNEADQTLQFQDLMNASVALPFWINGFGIIASLLGIYYVRNVKLADNTRLETLLQVITNGVIIATVATMAFAAFCVFTLFDVVTGGKLLGSLSVGLIAGVVIAKFTEYCTAYDFAPTRGISSAAEYGPAPVIIKGLGVGMLSVGVPAGTIAVTIIACNALSGQYGVAIAAVGLLATLGITLATDAYGPVADNAGGIAEMAHLEPEVRSRTDKLDALGNTTAATGKGLAIASATLTAVGLIAAFVEQSGLIRINNDLTPQSVTDAGLDSAGHYIFFDQILDLSSSTVLTGVLLGACLPYIFAALTMLSVDRGARAIITEVRLQFATAPNLMRGAEEQIVDGHKYPDSTRCVAIATEAAIQEMVLPGVLAVFVPIVIGFLLGPKGTVGLLAGGLGGCFMLALTMATSGGAWDNAKKWNEKCASEGEPVDGASSEKVTFTNYGVKLKDEEKNLPDFREMVREFGIDSMLTKEQAGLFRGDAGEKELFHLLAKKYHNMHAATVTGDTVGDPFKDTSGPSLNVLIKTMTMMALMLAPAYKNFGEVSRAGRVGERRRAVRACASCARPAPRRRATPRIPFPSLACLFVFPPLRSGTASARRARSSPPCSPSSSAPFRTCSCPTLAASTRARRPCRWPPRRPPTCATSPRAAPASTTPAAARATTTRRAASSSRCCAPRCLPTAPAPQLAAAAAAGRPRAARALRGARLCRWLPFSSLPTPRKISRSLRVPPKKYPSFVPFPLLCMCRRPDFPHTPPVRHC